VAEERIEDDDFESQIGFGELSAACDDPGELQIGGSFNCTAQTEDGRTFDLVATQTDDDNINIATTNVVVASALSRIESAAIEVVNEQFGLGVSPDGIDCGETSIILGPDQTIPCTLTGADGQQYDAPITMTDLETGEFTISPSPVAG
jgi:hypothetical protein